jgi:hypothetical protein
MGINCSKYDEHGMTREDWTWIKHANHGMAVEIIKKLVAQPQKGIPSKVMKYYMDLPLDENRALCIADINGPAVPKLDVVQPQQRGYVVNEIVKRWLYAKLKEGTQDAYMQIATVYYGLNAIIRDKKK